MSPRRSTRPLLRSQLPLGLAVACSLLASGARADWIANGAAVCLGAGDQTSVQTVSDGAGGAIVVWVDTRAGAGNSDIYAQRVLSSGALAWLSTGLPLCTATGNQLTPVAVSDGAGGVIVAWDDQRGGVANSDIYAQHVLSTGALASGWAANGNALCTIAGRQGNPCIAAAASGGVIVAWEDDRGDNTDIFAQCVTSSGTIAAGWLANGVAVCTALGSQVNPVCASDGASGTIVTWEDYRGTEHDIYAQRLTSAGSANWTAQGVLVCGATSDQAAPAIIADGSGGAIIAWEDYRSIDSGDIYAMRLSSNGSAVSGWTADGVVVSATPEDQAAPELVSDGTGGAIITWEDYRNGDHSTRDIYSQRLGADGIVAGGWTANGVPLCVATGDQNAPRIVTDGSNGALVAWYDYRGGSETDIYAQHVTAAGALAPGWGSGGIAICTAAYDQQYPAMTSNGAGGAVITWTDHRNNADYNVYAQRVTPNGVVGSTVGVGDEAGLSFRLLDPAPNPSRDMMRLDFELPTERRLDAQVFDVAGRPVRSLGAGLYSAGAHALVWDGRDDGGGRVGAGIYFIRVQSGAESASRRIARLD
jgi:hypothetical protein